jgi:hypothetical protein
MLSVFVVCSVFLWYYDMLVLRLTAEGVDMVLFNRDADSDRPFSPNGSERNRPGSVNYGLSMGSSREFWLTR